MYIKFPYEQHQSEHGIAGMPDTVGVIDFTHARMKAPPTEFMQFLNRKTIIQSMCKQSLTLTAASSALWPAGQEAPTPPLFQTIAQWECVWRQ